MTTKKAIKILDFVLQHKQEHRNGLLDPQKSWNMGNDQISSLAKTIASNIDDDMLVLRLVKQQLQTKCRHPKKVRDIDPDGKSYCTGCNQDL